MVVCLTDVKCEYISHSHCVEIIKWQKSYNKIERGETQPSDLKRN